MNKSLWSLVLLAAFVFTGCGTPSIHPLFSDDARATDPGLVGAWRLADESDKSTTYTIAADGDRYSMVADNRDAKDPKKLKFEVRLVQLGKHRFMDISASESDRRNFDDEWGPFVISTHLFVRYEREADKLTVYVLNNDWLRKGLHDGRLKLAHTTIDHDSTLITAETAELQSFFGAHAEDIGAFEPTELKRLKP